MKKHKHTIMMAILASATSLGAQQYSDEPGFDAPRNEWDNCCLQQDNCCDPGRFLFRADVLYWKPHLTSLELDFGTSTLSNTIVDGLQTITSDEFDSDPHFKWNAGYRIGAGYELADRQLEFGAIWTHFQDSGSRSIDEDAVTVNTTRARIKFDQIDLVVAYNSQFLSFDFRPFAGLRGARVHDSIHALIVADITLVPGGPATETRTLDDSQNYTGIGPILGFNGSWDAGNGFSIYGTAAASVLYSRYHVHLDDTSIFSAPLSRNVSGTVTKHLRAIDWNIDLAIGLRWETYVYDSYLVSMQLGFEHHQFFNQNHLGANRGDLTFDGGTFSIGIAL